MTDSTPPQAEFAAFADRFAGIAKLSRRDLPALREAVGELGFAWFSVDLSRARNVPGFIKALQRDLRFPDWFGGNLDALNDCLSDFSWCPAPGYVITLDHVEMLATSPTAFAAFNEVLASAVDEWQRRETPFWIFYLTETVDNDPASGV